MAEVHLVDVSIRDGNQSNWGATGLRTAQILNIAPTMDRVGFSAVDFISSAAMGVAVRYFREDPWERIRRTRELMPNTKLQSIGTGLRFISWEAQDAEFMRIVYRRLIANGIRRFVVLEPTLDRTLLLETARIMREEGAEEIIAALTYTISTVHDDRFYGDLAGVIAAAPDIDRAYIKDPAGLLTADRARTLIPAIRAGLRGKALEVHSHCTIGLAGYMVTVAAELGVEAIHVALGPLANGSSLPSATRVVANLRELGHTVPIDDRALARASDYFTALAEVEGLKSGTPQDYDATFLHHQVAGGVMTTTLRQLEELKLGHKFPEVMQEVDRVRTELGYPIMVTPFPQIVCTQAMFNVVGSERYANVPDQVIRYVLGKFGKPIAPVDRNVLDRILSMPRAREIMAEPPPPTIRELRRRFGESLSDDEFLLRVTMPTEQVDSMLAAGPAGRRYNPDGKRLGDTLRDAATANPNKASLSFNKGGLRVEVRGRPGSAAIRA